MIKIFDIGFLYYDSVFVEQLFICGSLHLLLQYLFNYFWRFCLCVQNLSNEANWPSMTVSQLQKKREKICEFNVKIPFIKKLANTMVIE